MTHKTICSSVLLAGAVALGSAVILSGAAMQAQSVKTTLGGGLSADAGASYAFERAKLEPSNCGCFWLGGGSGDFAVTIFKGLGLAANVTGDQAYNNLPTGEGLNKMSYLGGPRYTYKAPRLLKKHPTQFFSEALFGKVHGTNSVFPGATGTTTQATAFAMQAGVGMDIALYKGFGVRAFEVDYVYTQLPNNGSNTQDDLKLSAGLSYHFGKR